jgi:hypothetical protein
LVIAASVHRRPRLRLTIRQPVKGFGRLLAEMVAG